MMRSSKNYFFIKKFVFAVLFFALILFFCVGDFIVFSKDYKYLGHTFKKIKTVDEIKAWTANADSTIASSVIGKMNFIELYGYIQKLMGKREFNNFSYIKDDNNMLYYGSVTDLETNDLDKYANNVKRLNDYVESKGGHLLIVIPPTKVLYGPADLNKDWPINDPNNRTDMLMSMLQQRGVDAFDLRYCIANTGLSLEKLFFKTDHHWTPLASFYAFKAIIEKMDTLYDIDLDPKDYYTDFSNYKSYTYKNSFLGSTGENAGAAYSGMDDYTFYWPECDMNFVWYDYEHDEVQRGKLTEALLYSTRINEADTVYDTNMGSVYLREIVDNERIVNKSNPDAPKLTVLRDSYFTPIAVFMAPMFSQIDMLWTRNASDIDMEDYIKEEDFDYVILEVYPYNLDELSFDFFNE
ncbi:MAG: hypothetical protein K6E98_04690 [Lachnospiraceae bacterium]|nr:hypothetical protein [Lachnospiraceae bacterium]